MPQIPLPLIGISLALLGYFLCRWLWSRPRPPLAAMRPAFAQTALDANELGNEALDMALIRKVQAENDRIGLDGGYRWSKPTPQDNRRDQ